jgi:alpha-1,3-glucan synthase
MSSQVASGNPNRSIITTSSTTMAAIAIPISALFLAVASAVYFGLPKYYRQDPGQVPSFYAAIFRRKIVLWFFVVVLIQNYFLSASTGRNWRYLWSSRYASAWQIICLVILFFIIVWAIILLIFGRLTKEHSWILPLFAVGLGAPRWAQILFSCSGVGVYLPWVGSPLLSALVSRSLWLWLGTLDAIQGVGLGMILLQTLTRLHIAYTLIVAQILGSIATITARATAPNRIGPGDAFPDFSMGFFPGLGKVWFWVGLLGQIVVCVGFFRFFRKEQLSKP